jgi:hypothetical protein
MLYGVKETPFKVVCEFGKNHYASRTIRFSFYFRNNISIYWDEEFPEE